MRRASLVLASGLAGLLMVSAGSAHALTMQECSAKYQEAKKAGGKLSWSDFRKTECGTAASTAATPAPAAAAPAAAAPRAGAAASAPAAVSYPSAVDPKYANEKPGKARMQTCLDAYNAAKANGTLGGMKWIAKGGGYYSTCNARLKG